MKLPKGYTELQYIQSSGTQRIDTEVIPNQDTRVLMDAEVLSSNTGTNHHLGTVYSNSQYWTLRLRSDKSGFAARYDAKPLTNLAHDGDVFGRHIFDQNKNIAKVDNAASITFAIDTWSATLSLPIFCYRGGEETFTGFISMKLYSEKIYDNDVLVRDFIPCMNPDGQGGLYDSLNSKFYGNAGNGIFCMGPRRVILPKGYAQLEYIQGTGTQYIDTEFKPNSNSRVVIDFQMTAFPGDYQGLFSARDGASESYRNAFSLWVNNQQQYRTDFSVDGGPSFGAANLLRHVADKNKNITTIDDMSVSNSFATFNCNYNMLLLSGRSGSVIEYYANAKLYSCRIYDNDVLVRDFIPCMNPAGAVGLYDLANGNFYTNAGTGTFDAGPEVTWPANDAIYVKVNGIWKQIDGIKLL